MIKQASGWAPTGDGWVRMSAPLPCGRAGAAVQFFAPANTLLHCLELPCCSIGHEKGNNTHLCKKHSWVPSPWLSLAAPLLHPWFGQHSPACWCPGRRGPTAQVTSCLLLLCTVTETCTPAGGQRPTTGPGLCASLPRATFALVAQYIPFDIFTLVKCFNRFII